MSKRIIEKILKEKIIAIIRDIPSTQIIDLVTYLNKGGISFVEITFDHTSTEAMKDTLLSIRKIKEHFSEKCMVGAGTVMTALQVQQSVNAGAEYIISPNVDEEVIKETKALGKTSIAGALTPSEMALAYKYGTDVVKLFPAGILGTDYIKAVKAPLKHIPIIAVGGVTAKNCIEFIKAGAVGVGVGGNLVSKQLVDEGRFDEIEAIAKEYVESLRGF